MLQVVDEVAHASRLCFKVPVVVLVRSDLHRYAPNYLDPQSLHPLNLERVVGHKFDALGGRTDSKHIWEGRGGGAEVAEINRICGVRVLSSAHKLYDMFQFKIIHSKVRTTTENEGRLREAGLLRFPACPYGKYSINFLIY